jgi:hypothetical protein
MIASNPADDGPANSGLGANITIWSSPERRQSDCTCFQGAEREPLPPDSIEEVPNAEDFPPSHPVEDLSAVNPRFSVISDTSYYTALTTPVSDHRLSIASSHQAVPMTPMQEPSIALDSIPPTVPSHAAFVGGTRISTIPEVVDLEDPDFPESVMVNLGGSDRSSLSSYASTATLHGQTTSSDTSSSPTLDGASPTPPSRPQDARERRNHHEFFRNANNITVGEIHTLNAQNVTISPRFNIGPNAIIAPTVTVNLIICPQHGRPSSPPRHFTM